MAKKYSDFQKPSYQDNYDDILDKYPLQEREAEKHEEYVIQSTRESPAANETACPTLSGEIMYFDSDTLEKYYYTKMVFVTDGSAAEPLTEEIGSNLCRVRRNPCYREYGGYRMDILTENLNERDKVGFICIVCSGVMKEACISSSGEQFCSCCRNIYSYSKEIPSVPVRKMINTLKCSCPLSERGCKWLGTLKDCENHLDTCGYVYVSCKLKCGVVLRRNELEKHEKETCSQRVVKCDHCNMRMISGELTKHLGKCPKIKVSCNLCGEVMASEDMERHLKHDCGMVQETCQLGCGVTLTRNELKIHEKETCSQRVVKCDHCKKDFKSGELNEHLNKCAKMKVPCDLCDTQITREDMPQHLKHDCGMVQETCQLGCGVTLSRNELKIHEKETCSQRVVKCEYCKKAYKYYKLNEHLNKCPKMKVPCDLCDTQITREDMPQHLKHDCGMVQETCQLGCGVKLTRNELIIHVKDTCVQRTIACEHCNISLKFCDYSKHLRECPNVKVSCELCDIGTMYRKDMTEHLKHDCGMVQETCQLGCGVKLTRNELIIHVKDTCVQRKIACEHCDISVKFCDNSRHLKECPKVKVSCDLCDIGMMYRKDMTKHLKDYCPEKMIECLFVKYKCTTVVKRKDMDNHLEEKETKHLGLRLTAMEDLISKQSENFSKQRDEITKQSEENSKQSEEITKQSEEISKQREEIIKQREEISKQREEITKQREEITKQSVEFENKHCIASMEFEKEKRSIKLLYSITNVTSLVWNIGNMTQPMKADRYSVSKQYSMSKHYHEAGYCFSFKLSSGGELSIVFPETTVKYDNPFIAKCHIALSSGGINCGRVEVKQKDLTRGCERVIARIPFTDMCSNLTLEIYLTMQ